LTIKNTKKLFADTVITTTHLLKKCVKVPKLEEEKEEVESPDELEEEDLPLT